MGSLEEFDRRQITANRLSRCDASANDCGHKHHAFCYCDEDQGSRYTYSDEYGDCAFCRGEFEAGVIICSDKYNKLRVCPWFDEDMDPEILRA